VATLEPAAGPGTKIFPPTHAVDDRKPGAKYAFETRRIGGQDVACVLIDSVQSQANRMEEAPQAPWADKKIAPPVVSVDFSSIAPEVGRVTSLTAPHRIADALLRDSLLDGQPFRLSDIGKSFTDASTKNATALFKVCPTGLVFGLWDSTGPKGGLGAKFQRVLVSEVVGINAVKGSKTSSRIEPTNISKDAAVLYKAAAHEEMWTADPEEAEKDEGGEPIKVGKKEKAGKPSAVVLGNIAPSIDTVAGGGTSGYGDPDQRAMEPCGDHDVPTLSAALIIKLFPPPGPLDLDTAERTPISATEGDGMTRHFALMASALALAATAAFAQDAPEVPDTLVQWQADPAQTFEAYETSLSAFEWLARPVVVFADSPADPRFQQQLAYLLDGMDALVERDVVVLLDTDPDRRSEIRLQLRPRGFMLVIMGKDGEVELRKPLPWNVREITRTIDKMPLRQQEIRSGS